jgi:serine/threonine protein kinase
MASAFWEHQMHANSASTEEEDPGQTMRGVVGGTKLFNRFTLQKVLGRGGMGIVWLARDDRLEQLVALKLVPESVSFDPSAQEDLKRETRKSLMLTHPNIVRIFDFIEDEHAAAISMEYVDGATLSSLRVQKRAKCFAVSEIAPWVTSLCDALAYAHDSPRLIHRDLKPSNLMVNSRMELKVTDFGIACTIRDSMNFVSVRTSSGTLNYMSPQQMLGEDPSPSDDIYAVGATLYELLSSKPPFFGGDVGTQVREVTAPWVAERREQLGIAGEAVPKYWEEAIAACLEKNPELRPKNPADLARRLRLGGTIRLAAAQQESKMRALMNSLTHARIVGAAAGVAALIAAAVLAFRSSHHDVATVKREVNLAVPDGYALELRKTDTKSAPPTATMEPIEVATVAAPQVPSSVPEIKNSTVTLTTTPAGANFAVYSGVIAGKAAPAAQPLRSGTAPDSIDDLPPGRYTLFFHNEGWPDDRTEISLDPGETLPVEYTFPHGSANITSAPDGAEVFLGNHSLGKTPLTVDLPLGKQQLTARYPDRADRTQSITIDNGRPVTMAFQMREQNHSKSHAKAKPPASTLGKIGQTLKNVFGPKSPAKAKH